MQVKAAIASAVVEVAFARRKTFHYFYMPQLVPKLENRTTLTFSSRESLPYVFQTRKILKGSSFSTLVCFKCNKVSG